MQFPPALGGCLVPSGREALYGILTAGIAIVPSADWHSLDISASSSISCVWHSLVMERIRIGTTVAAPTNSSKLIVRRFLETYLHTTGSTDFIVRKSRSYGCLGLCSEPKGKLKIC